MRRPNIFANCKAGCPWRTVHYDEWAEGAAYIRQYTDENDEYMIEVGKTYKIFSTMTQGQYDCRLVYRYTLDGAEVEFEIPFANGEKINDYFMFRLQLVEANDVDGQIAIHYDIEGINYTQTFAADTDDVGAFVYVSNATKCFICNDVGLEKRMADYERRVLEIAPYFLVEPDESGECAIEQGKEYKVFLPEGRSSIGVKCTYRRSSYSTLLTDTAAIYIDSDTTFASFKFTGISKYSSDSGNDSLKFNYELNGNAGYSFLNLDGEVSNSSALETAAFINTEKVLLKNEEPYLR